MTTLNFLKNQVTETRKFTKKLIGEMPEDLWYVIPENTNSNFAWQIGHILMAQNFHIFACALGRNHQLMEKIPMMEYSKVFRGLGSSERSVEKSFASPEMLKVHFDLVFDTCMEGLEKANDEILSQDLEPIPFKHPVATNKYEAISWSFKHEMWHCAEMEHIKLLVGKQTKWLG